VEIYTYIGCSHEMPTEQEARSEDISIRGLLLSPRIRYRGFMDMFLNKVRIDYIAKFAKR
jgi:hypothetical protein